MVDGTVCSGTIPGLSTINKELSPVYLAQHGETDWSLSAA